MELKDTIDGSFKLAERKKSVTDELTILMLKRSLLTKIMHILQMEMLTMR